jgi:hypothetical protein
VDIHDDITVTLPHWKWMYFLGWLGAHVTIGEDATVDDVTQAIESGVKP